MTASAEQVMQLHDNMLEQEMRILERAEELGTLRLKICAQRDPGLLQEAAELAGELAEEAEEYQEWLEGQLEKASVE